MVAAAKDNLMPKIQSALENSNALWILQSNYWHLRDNQYLLPTVWICSLALLWLFILHLQNI